jgi:TolA-binding protein
MRRRHILNSGFVIASVLGITSLFASNSAQNSVAAGATSPSTSNDASSNYRQKVEEMTDQIRKLEAENAALRRAYAKEIEEIGQMTKRLEQLQLSRNFQDIPLPTTPHNSMPPAAREYQFNGVPFYIVPLVQDKPRTALCNPPTSP